MAANGTREYELVLMLDPEASDERREQIVADAKARIEGAGTLKHDSAWGMRNLAFEIEQRTEADYRFFRFQSEAPLLEALDHELKIADGVLRFRIFKVDPRSPMIVPPAPASTAARPPRRAAESEAPAAEAQGEEEPSPADAPAAEAPEAPVPVATEEPQPAALEDGAPEPATEAEGEPEAAEE